MTKVIQLVNITDNGNGTQSLIAECNGYENDQLVKQFSRSPFSFSSSMTEQEIIDYLWLNEYSIYA